MNDASDGNGRLEFNMGAAGSVGTIYLTNVSVKKLSDASAGELDAKGILADGNLLYNGKFREGDGHLGFWEFDNQANAEISVTDFADGRRLKVEIPSQEDNGVLTVGQSNLAVSAGVNYIVSFEAEAEEETAVTVVVCGKEYQQTLTKGKNTYTIDIPAITNAADKHFAFKLAAPGTVYLDEVRFIESAMILNGSFNAGFAGSEWFVDASANATYVVDSLTEDNALDVTVNNTSDQDWKVQIKQNNITLEKGKTYTLTFRAKSSMNRNIRLLLQGLEGLGWPEYSGEGIFALTREYQTFNTTFTMEAETDEAAFLSICLGMVDEVITTQHRILIDDISLCEVE